VVLPMSTARNSSGSSGLCPGEAQEAYKEEDLIRVVGTLALAAVAVMAMLVSGVVALEIYLDYMKRNGKVVPAWVLKFARSS
jgi:hypothetical protein